MKIELLRYKKRFLTCPECGELSSFFYLKDIKWWVEKHNRECGVGSFKEEGCVEVIV